MAIANASPPKHLFVCQRPAHVDTDGRHAAPRRSRGRWDPLVFFATEHVFGNELLQELVAYKETKVF